MSIYKTVNLRTFVSWIGRSVRCPTRPMIERFASSVTSINIDDSGLAVLAMKKPPVNSLDLPTLQEISQRVKELENTAGCKGFVLASDVPKVFSAGLDIKKLHKANKDDLAVFWRALQDVWFNLFTTKLATAAAITGHAPAGGCLMTLCCDYRIMVPGYTIGLNEVMLGFTAPPWLQDTMEFTIGSRKTERALCLGKLFTTEEALQIGIVDDLATSNEEAVTKAKKELRKLAAIPEHARQASKRSIRQPIVKKFLEYRDQDVENYAKFISSDKLQSIIGAYFEGLKKK